MMQVPAARCLYCAWQDMGKGWQHGEARITLKHRLGGIAGGRL